VRSIINHLPGVRSAIMALPYAMAATCIHVAIVIAVSGSDSMLDRYLAALRTSLD
jgi:hypothetical protein